MDARAREQREKEKDGGGGRRRATHKVAGKVWRDYLAEIKRQKDVEPAADDKTLCVW